MDQAIQIVIGALQLGSVFAVIALGFSLVYRVTGIINLAQGMFCVLGALGTYTLQVTLKWPLPWAIVAAVLGTTAYGVVLGLTAFVPALSRLSQGSILMLSAGALTMTDGIILLTWGGDPYSLPPFSQEAPVQILGLRLTTQAFWIVGATLLIIFAAWYLFARTTFGKALTACSENPLAARLMGINFNAMALVSFGLAALTGAIGGIVVAPLASLQFDSGHFFTLSGFMAVAIGGMSSFVGSVAGGIVLGLTEQLAAGYISSLFSNAVALCLLFAVMFFRPSGLISSRWVRRVDVREGVQFYRSIVRLRGWPAFGAGVIAVAVLAVLPLVSANDSLLGSLVITGIVFISVLGLDVLMGFGGQVSLGHAAFMAIGGYVAGILSASYGWPPVAATLAAAVCSLICAVVLALGTLKLRGVYLALATLSFGLLVDSLANGLMDVTGGPSGLVGVPGFSVLGYSFSSDISMYYLVLGLAVVLFVALCGAMQSAFGRTLMAIRADQVAAAALGINVPRFKLIAFSLSAVLASLSGSLYAFYFHFLSPDMVSTARSFELVAMLVIGGEGTLLGPLFGVALITILPTMVQEFAMYKTFVVGLLLVLCFRFLPQGILGALADLASRFLARQAPDTPRNSQLPTLSSNMLLARAQQESNRT
jgi:branched-chain amino acid transport system permease protein